MLREDPRCYFLAIRCLLAALLPSVALAQPVAGVYRCFSYNIDGAGGSCRITPPLVLNADGTYRMSSEKGTYKLLDGKVVLSESRTRGPGKLEAGNRIVFEYDLNGKRYTVTYLCQNCGSGK